MTGKISRGSLLSVPTFRYFIWSLRVEPIYNVNRPLVNLYGFGYGVGSGSFRDLLLVSVTI